MSLGLGRRDGRKLSGELEYAIDLDGFSRGIVSDGLAATTNKGLFLTHR